VSTFNPRLRVDEIRWLTPRSHHGLRVSLQGLGDVHARDVLIGAVPFNSLRGTVLEPGKVGDLVSTFWASVFLVTPRLVEALTNLGATGWRAVPVEIPEAPVALSLLCVTGQCGPIERASPGRVGQTLDPRTWDGSDLFVPANERRILVIGPMASALTEERLRNVDFELAGIELRGS
jgi:hypothetical protein